MPAEPRIRRTWCNSCFSETEHDVVHGEETVAAQADGSRSPAETTVLRCRGCRSFVLRRETPPPHIGTEGGDESDRVTETTYQPPRLWRRPPEWLAKLDVHGENTLELKALLAEVYSATNDQQFRLLAMGVRAALDNVMTYIVGDLGSFERKLDAMVAQGHLSKDRKEMLSTVIEAGSAAAHRGFKPPRDLLEHMVTAMEDVIGGHYITGPMLQQLRQHIPPRPSRRPSM